MEQVTTHDAKTRLSSLISRALQGEDIVICRGQHPLVRLVPVRQEREAPHRPSVGTLTSAPVTWTPDAFNPLNEEELKEWGL